MIDINDYDYIRIKEKIEEVRDGDLYFYITPFLSLAYQMAVNNLISKYHLPYHYFNSGERKCLIVGMEEGYEELNPVKILQIHSYDELHHNEIMGAVLGLGIKRETVGNIHAQDGLYLLEAEETIASYIRENLTSVSRYKVTVSEYEGTFPEAKHELKNIIVSSWRLDNVVSALFNLSREQAKTAIINEEVAYNFDTKLRPDQKVQPYSYLSCRGKGKVYLHEEVGTTRKDNLVLEAEYF